MINIGVFLISNDFQFLFRVIIFRIIVRSWFLTFCSGFCGSEAVYEVFKHFFGGVDRKKKRGKEGVDVFKVVPFYKSLSSLLQTGTEDSQPRGSPLAISKEGRETVGILTEPIGIKTVLSGPTGREEEQA